MAYITIMSECLNGNHKGCSGGISPPKGYFGGTICNCPCHKSDSLHPEKASLDTPYPFPKTRNELLEREIIVNYHKGLWVVILGLKPFKDGDHWCILYGENLHEGIAGFGKSPVEAMYDFDKAMYQHLSKE
jgi:hypothetical protein